MKEELEKFWEKHNQKLDILIGKLSVAAMTNNQAMAKECHQGLIDFSVWVDRQFEEVSERAG